MLIRVVLVVSLCLFGFACEKKGGEEASGGAVKQGDGKITITEGGQTQPGTATVKNADPGQQDGVVSTPASGGSNE
ncbi:MAG: hypothetical protein MK089_06190 [Phycisphaerales bacterium]|nr:hypothetical protein [Phycisphaerae bacterium]MCH2152914.1 hypothetical protein [Phycisphaerales bacterium]|tara:strand:+ start:67 stop:294 length:228 start_codon:yes stop_codon:yes gene_type:complete